MPNVNQNQNKETILLLARVESALERDSFDEAITALHQILAIKNQNQANKKDLADVYYDLATTYLSASASSNQRKEKDYLNLGKKFVSLAINCYPSTLKYAADLKECNKVFKEISQRLKRTNKKTDSTRAHYRESLTNGTLFISSYIEGDVLNLRLNPRFRNHKSYLGIQKMLRGMQRIRPEFRGRFEMRGWDKDKENFRLKIIAKEKHTAQNYLQFIQEQAKTSRSKRYLNMVAEGRVIVRVTKIADSVTLVLDPDLSSEDIYGINVALYNKYNSSDEFKRYFGSPKKNQSHPSMTLMEPGKALSAKEIKLLICRLCTKHYVTKRKRSPKRSGSIEEMRSALTSADSNQIVLDDALELPVFSFHPAFDTFTQTTNVQPWMQTVQSPSNNVDIVEADVNEWLRMIK